MTGLELVAACRATVPGLSAIIVAANPSSELRAAIDASGNAELLERPLSVDALLAAIDRADERRGVRPVVELAAGPGRPPLPALESGREALRELLVAERPGVLERLANPATRTAAEGTPPLRELRVQDSAACLFGRVLRDGQSALLVATDPTENPGRLWARIKVLILALGA